jgi:N-acetylmuramoyl-L-alanine amidase
MVAALVVSVLINGVLVAASSPAELLGGTVAAPVDPYVGTIARRVTIDGSGRLTFERDGRCLQAALGSRMAEADRIPAPLPIAPYLRDGRVIIPLASVARALGADVRYDGRTRTLEIETRPRPLATMTPFVSWSPPPGPLATFTPNPTPAPATRATAGGTPRPRRTPILVQHGYP